MRSYYYVQVTTTSSEVLLLCTGDLLVVRSYYYVQVTTTSSEVLLLCTGDLLVVRSYYYVQVTITSSEVLLLCTGDFEWHSVTVSGDVLPARYAHSAVAYKEKVGSCACVISSASRGVISSVSNVSFVQAERVLLRSSKWMPMGKKL